MIYEEDHWQSILPVGLQDLLQLVERTAAVDHVPNHLKISELHLEWIEARN